jgi:hypothetical protein
MTEVPRRRALVNGLLGSFESRNPNLATVRWHPRFKMRYRTKADVQAAKEAWEQRGKILWPDDLKQKAKAKAATVLCGAAEVQGEMRV